MNSKATQPKKDTNHSLKETHRNTVLFDVKPFSDLKSLATRPNWAFDEWNLTTALTKHIENPTEATLKYKKRWKPIFIQDDKLNLIWDMDPIFWKHPKICKGSFLMYQTSKVTKSSRQKNDDCKKRPKIVEIAGTYL